MSYLDLMTERYSVRDFFDKKVSDRDLSIILEAGRLSPTAVNLQPEVIYIIKSDKAIEKLRKATRMAYNAPLGLLVCYDKNISWKNVNDRTGVHDSGEVDATIVATNMMNQATELGLGTLWARGYDTQNLIDAFDIPENIVPVCLLMIGYSKYEPSPKHFQRKSVKEITLAV